MKFFRESVAKFLGAAWAMLAGGMAVAAEPPRIPAPEGIREVAAEADRWTLIHCGGLLDVPGKPARGNSTLVVKNDAVERVVDGYAAVDAVVPAERRAGAKVIDLKNRFVLPGLIDCHVHLTFETSADARLRGLTDSDAATVLNGVVYARRTLEAGFTTVRDVGSQKDICFALRDAINEGKVVGPRILASGESISPTGGHGDGTNGLRDDVLAVPGPIQGIADGVDACRLAVRNQVKHGADVIKCTATGGVLSNIGAGLEQQFFDDELKAIVETAHLLGKKVAAHAHGTRGINAALRAGVDSIEHGTYLDDESIRLFKEKGAYYVPTITAGKTVSEYAAFPRYYSSAVVPKAKEVGPKIQGAFTRAYKGGVKIAFGTDAGVFPHGANALEFRYMNEGGMSGAECIVAATINAADLLAISSKVGTLEPGKSADVIATAGDPTKDVAELQAVKFVMMRGNVAKQE
jgi:imidazolonepropionase-like amidohydrolase